METPGHLMDGTASEMMRGRAGGNSGGQVQIILAWSLEGFCLFPLLREGPHSLVLPDGHRGTVNITTFKQPCGCSLVWAGVTETDASTWVRV